MMERVFGHGEHLQNVAAEGTLDHVEINILKVLAHYLLGGIVDENVDLAKGVDMLLDGFAAGLVVHEVAGDEQAFPSLLLHHLLGLFGVLLFFREVDDAHVCALAGKQQSDRPANSRARREGRTCEKCWFWPKIAG